MTCLYCQRKIGLLRLLTDREYCSKEHRVMKRSQSARALRESSDYDSFDSFDNDSTVFVKPIRGIAAKRPGSQSSVTSTATFGLLLVAGVFIATLVPDQGGSSRAMSADAGSGTIQSLRRAIRSYATIRLEENFKTGLSAWTPSGSSGRDWNFKNGFAQPGKMRIWKSSVDLSDYNLEFVGEIEQKGLSWAYRAKDSRNYYASRIVITKPGPLPTADLVRYAVVNGVERARAATPLNMPLRRDTLYRVHMTVKGRDFSTAVNGQMVDTWSDERLRTGGVGFFAEGGEVASLRYVQITDKDTVVGRLLSYLSFVRPMAPPVF
jgi:hypothetical protein